MSKLNLFTGFTLKKEIDLGQIFTALSILVSVVGLVIAWSQDRHLKEQEYADRVRRSAAVVTAKIERWAELESRYFEDLQAPLIDVSENIIETHSREPANRVLYKSLVEAKAKSSQRIVEEQLQLSYMELYTYVPAFEPVFDKTINDIKIAESSMYAEVSNTLQAVLLDPQVLELKESPSVGNILRTKLEEHRQAFIARIRGISSPLRKKMLTIIEMPDEELRDPRLQPRIAALFSLTNASPQSSK